MTSEIIKWIVELLRIIRFINNKKSNARNRIKSTCKCGNFWHSNRKDHIKSSFPDVRNLILITFVTSVVMYSLTNKVFLVAFFFFFFLFIVYKKLYNLNINIPSMILWQPFQNVLENLFTSAQDVSEDRIGRTSVFTWHPGKKTYETL